MGSVPALDEVAITANFDRRVEDGTIIYDQNYQTVKYLDDGFSFEFRILSGLHKKPTPAFSPPLQSSSGCAPGSDIDVSGYKVADLGSTHLVAFNKFSSARPHLLVLTQDGFRRQHEALDIDDMTALRNVLLSLDDTASKYLAIFNCGVESGCSRLHKHMQVFPAPQDFPLWPDSEPDAAAGAAAGGSEPAGVPFRCFVHHFEKDNDGLDEVSGVGGNASSAREVTEIYQELLRRAESCLSATSSPGSSMKTGRAAAVPHNMILSRKWIVVVPRRRAGVNGADVNAAGFLGMVWVSSEDKMRRWTEQGPGVVLREVGLPASSSG